MTRWGVEQGSTPPVTITPVTSRQRRRGHSTTRQVRKVCRKCNNGWLSRLEEKIKPLLVSLMNGESCFLGIPEQTMLATWAMKTVMTAEFMEPTMSAVPIEDREFLMRTLSPPPAGWWIWIAGSQGEEWRT